MRRILPCLLALLLVVSAAPALAQSQAANGAIEGTVRDNSGGVLPGVTVSVANADTGTLRIVVTNESGLYRAVLLPLGTYRVTAELAGFKKHEQGGIELGAGRTAEINITLQVGDLNETVSVTADSPIVDPAKIDLGRNLNEREVKNLPLVSRNPYNFALLQPGVTGYENSEFGVPRFSANGTLLRINYQIDGNTNTQKDRAGLRLLPVSEVMVREVKVVTSGYAPEFGQTTGLVYNAITPSGTNNVRGSASYRFRRKDMSARPFFLSSPAKPDTHVDTFTADVGGPVVRDRLHYYVGFENTARDLSADRVITIKPEDAARIGLTTAESSGVIPAEQSARFLIAKADYQLNTANRLTARYIMFRNDSPSNIGATSGGTPSSTEWATDFLDSMDSTSAQLVSSIGSTKLNELRVQFAHRHQSRATNDLSGSGPALTISGVANFGGPYQGAQDAEFDFKQNIWQVIDNFTWLVGDHSLKAGVDMQFVGDFRATTPRLAYTFTSIDNYLAAKSGANPRAYSTFLQFLGPTDFDMDSSLFSAFVQDDWRVTPTFKVLYGVRYDVYGYPEGDPNAPFEYSRSFNSDRNNFGPRLGAAWSLNEKTVLRASTGVMYDQPLLAAYENAVQSNGVRTYTVSLSPTSAGAPDYPNSLSGTGGIALPTQSIFAVDPAFVTMRTFQNNVQLDRALGRNYSASIGFVYVSGANLPVVNNINLINPVGALADGRPIYSTAVSAATRMDPRFNQINTLQSIGDSTYKGLTLQLTRRFSGGFQFDLNYSVAKGEDNAPLTSTLSVQGDDGRSDPSNLDRDLGPNIMDTRHSFAGSIVARPEYRGQNGAARAILNDNQFGLMLLFNSGLPQNIRSNRDLNFDGILADRPLGVTRNSIYLPARYNVDFRYSRFFPLGGSRRAEVLLEMKNLFNNRQTSGIARIVTTDVAGNPLTPIPADGDSFPVAGRSGYEARQFQIGFKFYF
jgi:hypothetical protein